MRPTAAQAVVSKTAQDSQSRSKFHSDETQLVRTLDAMSPGARRCGVGCRTIAFALPAGRLVYNSDSISV